MEYKVLIGIFLLIILILLLIIFYMSKNGQNHHEQRNVMGISKVEPVTLTVPVVIDIVGKTTTVMKKPVEEIPEPDSEPEFIPLEMVPACETDPPYTPDDVEIDLPAPGEDAGDDLSEPEEIVIYLDQNNEDDFSQAMTFEQIKQALGVIKGEITDEENVLSAGETLYNMPPTMLEVISNHENYEFMVGTIINSYVEHPRSKRISKSLEDFDIGNYL